MQNCQCSEFGSGTGGEVWLRQDQYDGMTNNVWKSGVNNAILISNEIAKASVANVNALTDVKNAVNNSVAGITNGFGSAISGQTAGITNALAGLSGTITNQTGTLTNYLGQVGSSSNLNWEAMDQITVTSSNFPVGTATGGQILTNMQTMFHTSALNNIIPVTESSGLTVNFGYNIPHFGSSFVIDLSGIHNGVKLVRAILLGFEVLVGFWCGTWILRWSIA
jgi:hypothetical protein